MSSNTLLATVQLLAASGLILCAVMLGWRAGAAFWSRR